LPDAMASSSLLFKIMRKYDCCHYELIKTPLSLIVATRKCVGKNTSLIESLSHLALTNLTIV